MHTNFAWLIEKIFNRIGRLRSSVAFIRAVTHTVSHAAILAQVLPEAVAQVCATVCSKRSIEPYLAHVVVSSPLARSDDNPG